MFVGRFRSSSRPTDHVKLARTISWIVGAVVVLLSGLVVYVQGNLLEVTMKVCNLLTASWLPIGPGPRPMLQAETERTA